MANTHTGGCYCGAVEIEAQRRAVAEMGYCHCESMPALFGNAGKRFHIVEMAENVKLIKGEEFLGNSKAATSAIVDIARNAAATFSSMHPTLGLIDVRAGTPAGLFTFNPTVHLNYEETVLPMRDGLLKLKDFPAAYRWLR